MHHCSRAYSLLMSSLAAACLALTGCGPHAATGPADAFHEVAQPVLTDDLGLAGLREAINAELGVLTATSSTQMQMGPLAVSRGDYQRALAKLSEVLAQPIPTLQKLQYITDNFRFFEFNGAPQTQEVLLTGYFEPVIRGCTSRTNSCSRPLYAKPADLISVELRDFSERFKDEKSLKARLDKRRVVPYYTRREIDERGALANRSLELVWTDPIDAFFLQIQGSGTVMLPNGDELHLVYADKNGHKYEPIGKFLKDRLAPRKVTMQSIESLLRSMNPRERDAILFLNPSYVFFERSNRRAITSLGVPATPGRTIAVDPRFAPKGALAFVQFEKPIFKTSSQAEEEPVGYERSSRFVLDQDSGGAITGTGRVDLFWGRGDEAKRYAGVLQNRAKVLYLVPR